MLVRFLNKKPSQGDRSPLWLFNGVNAMNIHKKAVSWRLSGFCPACLARHTMQERLANALASEVGVNSKPLSQLKKNEKEQLLTALTAWQLPIQVNIATRALPVFSWPLNTAR